MLWAEPSNTKDTKELKNSIVHQLNIISITLDEPEAESVGGGAKPSKTDMAAPTSESNIESVCEVKKLA